MIDLITFAALFRKLNDDLGWDLLSGTEYEFKLYKNSNPADRIPIFPACEYLSTLPFSLNQNFLYHLESNLIDAGVQVYNMMSEFSSWQMEFVFKPAKGLSTADQGATVQPKKYV